MRQAGRALTASSSGRWRCRHRPASWAQIMAPLLHSISAASTAAAAGTRTPAAAAAAAGSTTHTPSQGKAARRGRPARQRAHALPGS